MEPVVAAANPEMGYGLSGVRLPPAVLSRVGGKRNRKTVRVV